MKLAPVIICVLFSALSWADSLVSCNDGDTCKIQTNKEIIKVRLWGIDAPESNQISAADSRDYLISLLKDKNLKLECFGHSYNRRVCKIEVEDKDVSAEMVKAGWAWDYPQYSSKVYNKLELEARKKKIGLWKSEKLESPFCYRHQGVKDCKKLNNIFQP